MAFRPTPSRTPGSRRRLGAAFLPAHDAFIRQHLADAMNKGVGVRHVHGQAARTICQSIPNALGQPLPAGL